MKTNALAFAVGLAVGTLGSVGLISVANASPLLTIVNTSPATQEQTGDPGGTSYPFVNGAGVSGPGLPSSIWPVGPGMTPDVSFGNVLGTSGWRGAYLTLDKATDVTFQYMGKGNSSLSNEFDVFTGGSWVTLFNSTTDACGAAGAIPVITCTPGTNQMTLAFGPGYVPFRFVTGSGVMATNDGAGNPAALPGYFLGVDPYLATGPYNFSGRAVYAGLSDLPGPGDHDFQDFGVRISVVPEPGSLSLALLGLAGLAVVSRRRRRAKV